MPQAHETVLARLIDIAAEVYCVDPAELARRPEKAFTELPEWDSLTHVSFLMEVESAFGADLPPAAAQLSPSLSDLADLIVRHVQIPQKMS